MVLEKKRDLARNKLTPLAKLLARVLTPNQTTFLALLQAFISMFFFLNNYLVLATIFAIISSIFDVFDGIIAREENLNTKKGNFLDHTIDRLSDAIILIGISFSSYTSISIGIVAIIGVLLTGYVGTQAEAIGVGRIYKGISSRSDIIFLISLGAILTFLFSQKIFGRYLLDWTLVLLAILTNLTALQRIFITWKRLN